MDQRSATVTVIVVAPPGRADALAEALASADIDVVGTTDAAGAVSLIADGAPDIVVTVTGPDELAATASIAATAAATRIVAVGSAEPGELIAGGVGAIVGDDASPEELVSTVLGLALGESRLDHGLASFIIDRIDGDEGLEPLTATEREVLTQLAAGEDVDTLADSYAVSPRMVRLISGGVLARVLQA
jgi:DNA-binding NarL/FixJ family response regulator